MAARPAARANGLRKPAAGCSETAHCGFRGCAFWLGLGNPESRKRHATDRSKASKARRKTARRVAVHSQSLPCPQRHFNETRPRPRRPLLGKNLFAFSPFSPSPVLTKGTRPSHPVQTAQLTFQTPWVSISRSRSALQSSSLLNTQTRFHHLLWQVLRLKFDPRSVP